MSIRKKCGTMFSKAEARNAKAKQLYSECEGIVGWVDDRFIVFVRPEDDIRDIVRMLEKTITVQAFMENGA